MRFYPLCLVSLILSTVGLGVHAVENTKPTAASLQDGFFSSMFWLWSDKEVDEPALLGRQAAEMKAAGFDTVYAMPRATRYQLTDPEMVAAVARASEACRRLGLAFVWGPDPRVLASVTTRETGYGAQVLLTTREYNKKPSAKGSEDPAAAFNEGTVEEGRYSLRFEYPARRDVHLLTDVGLWFSPVAVDRVFAYRWKDGKVEPSSLRDITASHHLFVNRSQYYVEVFGRVDLPGTDWRVIAFPRFMTNMYAFESPEHERRLVGLLDTYAQAGIRFDGFWWDEPGYYFQFGQYAAGETLYERFKARYGYELRDRLYALLLPLSDSSQNKVRRDYFELLMDEVFGAEKRFWQEGEKRFGVLRMGVHHTWHSIPDNMYNGSADLWRGLEGVDGGYTDDARFERYFQAGLAEKYGQVSYLIVAASLARFSKSGQAFYNRWGVDYGAEVPRYWNDLMPLFSNRWIQHAYGYTGVIGASRNFGPGFPNHPTWPILPELNRRARKVYEVTGYRLPEADVAFVYPFSELYAGLEPKNDRLIERVNSLLGAMPAAGVGVEAVSEDWLGEAEFKDGRLCVRGRAYRALVVPCATQMAPAALRVLQKLLAADFRVVFAESVPSRSSDGSPVALGARAELEIGGEDEGGSLTDRIEALHLPSLTTRLKGAYVSAIPGEGDALFVLAMPVEPGSEIGGRFMAKGVTVEVAPTKSLVIYRVAPGKAEEVFR